MQIQLSLTIINAPILLFAKCYMEESSTKSARLLNWLRNLSNPAGWRERLFLLATAFIISIGLFFLNPFGVQTYSDKTSSDVFNLLLGRFYPVGDRDRIVVVVVDDRDLDNAGETIPPSFNFHRRVFDSLALLNPGAVLVDFVFDRRHAGAAIAERNFIATLKDFPAPLYLAAVRSSPVSPDGVLPGLSAAGTIVTVPKFLNFTDSNLYCLYFPLDRPSFSAGKRLCAQRETGMATMAYAAWRDLCERSDPHGACDFAEDEKLGPFKLFWGSRPSPIFDYIRPPGTCGGPGFLAFLDPGERLYSDRCPYHAELPATELLCLASIAASNEDADGAEHVGLARFCDDPALMPSRKLAIAALNGATIVYGGRYGGNPDTVRPPTTPAIAGAHLHAMALDNLVTWRGHPKRDATMVFGFAVAGWWINLFIFVVMFGLSAFWSEMRFQRGVSTGRFKWILFSAAGQGVCMVGIAALFAFVAFSLMDLAPSNWIGAVIASSVLPEAIASTLAGIAGFWNEFNSRGKATI